MLSGKPSAKNAEGDNSSNNNTIPKNYLTGISLCSDINYYSSPFYQDTGSYGNNEQARRS
jgi:hypothetical protein